jgi:outer membrane protein assembly factor BamB
MHEFNSRRRRCARLMGMILIMLTAPAAAQEKSTDWPQFRGPGGLGVSSAKGLPVKWSQKENVVWKTALQGPGSSSPIVLGDKIYLTCYTGYNVPGKGRGDPANLKLHLVCLKRDNGKILWTSDVDPKLPEQDRIRDDHGYASSTPVTDGERIYVFFGKSGALAFDLDGKQLWRTDVGARVDGFGSGASPIVYKELVIVNASVESQSLVALDKKSGKDVWRVTGIREAWNTPLLVPLKDGKTELVVGMQGKVRGFDPVSGQDLWSCNNDIGWYIVPSVVAHEGVLWSIGGRSGITAIALKAGGRGDVTKTHRLWTSKQGSNVSSPIIHDGHLYWMHDSLGIAYCAEAMTGNIVYQERVERAGQIYSSPILADGKLYYTSRTGRTYVVAARPKFELVAANDLSDRSTFNASLAVAGNRLLLRSDTFLYCLGER